MKKENKAALIPYPPPHPKKQKPLKLRKPLEGDRLESHSAKE